MASKWRVLRLALLLVLAITPVARAGAAASQALSDLAITEVSAANTGNDVFAVLISGDGGWARLDQELSAQLASRGIPVAPSIAGRSHMAAMQVGMKALHAEPRRFL